MADRDELIERLSRRFKGVPNFDLTDAEELIDEAIEAHKNDKDASDDLVLLYAQTQGAWQIAFSVAHYFRFTDGEESVDKSMVADNYRKLARDLQVEYDKEIGKIFGNNFRIMTRIDRPNTTPPTGESGRRLWRRY